MPAAPHDLEHLDALLDGASLLGAELDTQYRVLALTIEPDGDDGDDRRLQVLLHPCAEVTALLLRTDGDESVIERFEQPQLPDVVAALDAPILAAPIVDAPPEAQFPSEVSMHGASSALDGRTHRALVDVRGGARRLVLTATFDDIEVRTPDGETVPLT